MPPVPRASSVRGTAPGDPAVPVVLALAVLASRVPRLPRRLRRRLRTASGRVRHVGGGAWVPRCRPSPRRSRRRGPPHRVARRCADSRGSPRVPSRWRRSGLALRACPGGVAVRPRLRPRARYGPGQDALRRPRPSCRLWWFWWWFRHHRDRVRHGPDHRGYGAGEPGGRSRRQPPARPRPSGPIRASASRALPRWRPSCSSAGGSPALDRPVARPRSALGVASAREALSVRSAPPAHAREPWWPAHPTGRSAAGRSGGGRSQAAPDAALPRSLDPCVTPFARSEGAIRIRDERLWRRGLAR